MEFCFTLLHFSSRGTKAFLGVIFKMSLNINFKRKVYNLRTQGNKQQM